MDTPKTLGEIKPNSVCSFAALQNDLFAFLFNKNDNPQLKHVLEAYLLKIESDSFIVEYPYVDNDYLEDYSSFYASCFTDYERFCARIHFFKRTEAFSLTQELLTKLLISYSEQTEQSLQAHYLGFIVRRPFARACVGRTCLVTYPEDEARHRYFPATRFYSSHLFGLTLSVKTMAFQEQDRTVTACASTAVWAALHMTGKIFQREIPSPSSVTKYALSHAPALRKFPSTGLNGEQICVAITRSGLTPLKTTIDSLRVFKAIVYAYLKAGIPIICGLSLYDLKNNSADIGSKNWHAVTINGYSFEDRSSVAEGNSNVSVSEREIEMTNDLQLYSSRMTLVYGHDDQLCPFSRMEVLDKYYKFDGFKTSMLRTGRQMLLTGWKSKSGDSKYAKVESLIIPLHDKIRVEFPSIYEQVMYLQRRFRILVGVSFEWEIYLQELVKWRNQILVSSKNPINLSKDEILMMSHPKYVWRAIARDEQLNECFELIFDTTESANGNGLRQFICYDRIYLVFEKLGVQF